ncbi:MULTISPECIES: ParB/RepB/Spo0J family partition protein [unclassified Bradyrhizobium]|uniref:ParB/RepB/Spo0J family partition protein n=1 Tax=unclassified Bradyrhizobium TaxID=2631580 RepID=UPI0028E58C96|nr:MULTISPECIES: ParB N-terminal domain-containing protein [unclassified Bradyrhizobium]
MSIKSYPVHPAAAIFPMMSEEEIADLAEDIKENGLKHPIVIGEHEGEEVLVDGRNRLRACELAKVQPTYHKLKDEDHLAFILSTNVKRRHLNSGQRAMAVAMMYPTPTPGKSLPDVGKTQGESVKTFQNNLSMARAVLADSRAAAEDVMAGTKFLDAAYQSARANQEAKREEQEKREYVSREAPDLLSLVQDTRISLDEAIERLQARQADQAKLAKIGADAPDLVALVNEGRMTAQDALAEHENRVDKERHSRKATTELLATVMRHLSVRSMKPAEDAERLMLKFDASYWPNGELGEPDAAMFKAAADLFAACARLRKKAIESKSATNAGHRRVPRHVRP